MQKSVTGHQLLTTIIRPTWESEIGWITVLAMPEQRVCETPTQQEKLLMVIHAYHPCDYEKLKEEDCGPDPPWEKVKPYLQK
jgi:hypothetical protein